MHQFARTDDAVYRAGFDAKLAANACVLPDIRNDFILLDPILGIEGFLGASSQRCQSSDSHRRTGRALVDVRFSCCNRRSIVPASRIIALSALGLRQHLVDLIDQRFIARV